MRFGKSFARMEYLVALVIAAEVIPFYLFNAQPGRMWVMLSAGALLPAIPSLSSVLTTEDGPALNNALAGTGKALVAFGVLFTVGWLV